MPMFHLEQYEFWLQCLKIEAADEADAIGKVLQGEGCPVSMRFAGIATDYGMGVNENANLAVRLWDREIIDRNDTIIPSIRSVQEIEATDQRRGASWKTTKPPKSMTSPQVRCRT